MKKIFLFLIIITSLTSCVEVLDIKLDDADKMLVMNGILTTDSNVTVNLSRSINALEGDAFIKFVDDADVFIYSDGNLLAKMTYDTNGYYSANIKPVIGKTYTVIAKENGKEVSAQTTIPSGVDLTTLEVNINIDSTTQSWTDPETGQTFDTTFYFYPDQGELYFEFNDPPNERNYYFVTAGFKIPNIVYDYNGNPYINGYRREASYLEISGDESYIGYYNDLVSGYAFSDYLFNGKTKKIKANFGLWPLSSDVEADAVFYVNFYSISEDYYKFIDTYDKYEAAIDNPFAEPVNIYTNINGGVGILASQNGVVDSVIVKTAPYNYYEGK